MNRKKLFITIVAVTIVTVLLALLSSCSGSVKKTAPRVITLKHGKNNIKCRLHVESMRKKYSPRYGCGKCQVGVPCEFRSPRAPK